MDANYVNYVKKLHRISVYWPQHRHCKVFIYIWNPKNILKIYVMGCRPGAVRMMGCVSMKFSFSKKG